LVYFAEIWDIFIRFGMSCQEKSGNPDELAFREKNVLLSSRTLAF
jgi:hypothetical protein